MIAALCRNHPIQWDAAVILPHSIIEQSIQRTAAVALPHSIREQSINKV